MRLCSASGTERCEPASPCLFPKESIRVQGGQWQRGHGDPKGHVWAEPLMGIGALRHGPGIWGILWSTSHHTEGLHGLGGCLGLTCRTGWTLCPTPIL